MEPEFTTPGLYIEEPRLPCRSHAVRPAPCGSQTPGVTPFANGSGRWNAVAELVSSGAQPVGSARRAGWPRSRRKASQWSGHSTRTAQRSETRRRDPLQLGSKKWQEVVQ